MQCGVLCMHRCGQSVGEERLSPYPTHQTLTSMNVLHIILHIYIYKTVTLRMNPRGSKHVVDIRK